MPGKTGEFDLSVILDSPWIQFMMGLLSELKVHRAGMTLWPFTYPELVAKFTTATLALGLKGLVLYQTRHSGASLDRISNRRSLTEVKQRGGWRSDRSVTRYDKHARLADQMQRKSTAQQAHFQVCETRLAGMFEPGKCVAPPYSLVRG